jgi:hypothetical protein
MGSIAGRAGGLFRFNVMRELAYSQSSIAMMLPPGNDRTSGSKLCPMLWSCAAIRPALDSINAFITYSFTVCLRCTVAA